MLDINTHIILLIIGLNKLLLGFFIIYLHQKVKDIKGVKYWGWGNVLSASGLIIFSFYRHEDIMLENLTYSLILQLFVLAGDTIFLTGFRIYRNKPIHKGILFLPPLLSMADVIFFTAFIPNNWIRYSINGLIGTVLYILFVIEMRKCARETSQKLFNVNSYIFAFFALREFLRMVLGLVLKPEHPIDIFLISINLFAFTGISYIFINYILVIIIYDSINKRLNEQIAAKNNLYRIISHDLRGPLGNLLNYNSILSKSVDKWKIEKVQSWVTEMDKLISATVYLTENLFNWSSSQLNEIKMNKKEGNMSSTIQEVLSFVEKIAVSKRINLVFNDNHSVLLNYDEDMIQIVLRNLLLNAIKYTPEGGEIKIAIVDKIHHIEVYVIDKGVGIENDRIPLLFDANKFSSTLGTNMEKGSGFGLLICNEFIHLHDGELSVESSIGKGSVFKFTIPKKNEEIETACSG